MRNACNSTYFVRAAAVRTKSKKKKYAIQNAALVLIPVSQSTELRQNVQSFIYGLTQDTPITSAVFQRSLHSTELNRAELHRNQLNWTNWTPQDKLN